MNHSNRRLTATEAISIIKAYYEEFNSYPDNSLPPKSISTERDSFGWYVAFVQEGSGRPIISAKCFFISDDRKIQYIGEYKPKINEKEESFSIKTCK